MKTCSGCKKSKDLPDFSKDKNRKDGLCIYCSKCRTNRNTKWYDKHRKPKLRLSPEEKKKNAKISLYNWRKNNPEKFAAVSARYYLKNKDRIKVKVVERERQRLKTDIEFRIKKRIRTRLFLAIKNGNFCKKFRNDLGCDSEYLMRYLESQFLPGMTWNNYGFGKGRWNIDHTIPLRLFNLEDKQHFVLANYYLNLKPMWHEENLRKSGKYPK